MKFDFKSNNEQWNSIFSNNNQTTLLRKVWRMHEMLMDVWWTGLYNWISTIWHYRLPIIGRLFYFYLISAKFYSCGIKNLLIVSFMKYIQNHSTQLFCVTSNKLQKKKKENKEKKEVGSNGGDQNFSLTLRNVKTKVLRGYPQISTAPRQLHL